MAARPGSETAERGGKLRTFNLIDEYTRECHCIHADRAIKAADVLALLQEAIARHGPPKYIRSDNGPEFIAKVIQTWLRDNHIQTIYIEPGCPWQNGDAESFNGRFRAECLNRELLYTLSESRVVFEDWRSYYNHERPHRSLGLQTPAKFAQSQSFEGPDSGRPTASLRRSLQEKRKKTDKPKPPETVSDDQEGDRRQAQPELRHHRQARPRHLLQAAGSQPQRRRRQGRQRPALLDLRQPVSLQPIFNPPESIIAKRPIRASMSRTRTTSDKRAPQTGNAVSGVCSSCSFRARSATTCSSF